MNDMTEVKKEERAEILAGEINTIKIQTVNIVLQASIEIGKRLIEAKELIGHGNWMNWLKESVDFSERKANQLMQIYKVYGPKQANMWITNELESEAGCGFEKLNYSQVVALLAIKDEDERKEFVETHDIENMSKRELEKAIKERDQAIIDKEKMQKELESAEKAKQELEDKKKKSDEKVAKSLEKINKLKQELETAKQEQSSERAEELEQKLQESEEELKKIKEQLNQPVTIEQVTIEKIPEATEKELQDLRNQLEAMKNDKTATKQEQAVLKYRMYFENIKTDFNNLFATLAEIQDLETKDKFTQATNKLIKMLGEKL